MAEPNPHIMEATEPQQTVLEVADNLIHGPRAKAYGHPSENLGAIADGWNAYMRNRPTLADGTPEPLRAHDVCQMMVILKALRAAAGYHRDSVVDICGYAALDAIVMEDDDY